MKEMVNLKAVERVEASSKSLRTIMAVDISDKEKVQGQRTATVAPNDLLFGMSGIYELLSELDETSPDVRVFRTRKDAEIRLEP